MKRPVLRLIAVALAVAPLLLSAQTGGRGEPTPGSAVSDLIAATKAKDAAGVSALLRAGADPNGRDAQGQTPLHYAAYRGSIPAAVYLIAAGAEVNGSDSLGLRPLHAAAFSGRSDMARLLIAMGASVNIGDQEGMTPLHYAAAGGNRDVAETLLVSGADVQALSNGGLTPAEAAYKSGYKTLSDLLRARDAESASVAPGTQKPRVYTDADIDAVRSRNRLANEEQLGARNPPRREAIPTIPSPGAEGEGTDELALARSGGFKSAFEQGVWNEDIEGAIQFAKDIRKPLLILFTGSDWCAWCKKLEAEVLSRSTFREGVKGKYVLLYLDLPRSKAVPKDVLDQRKRLAKRFDVSGYPTLVVLQNGDQYLDRISGFPRGMNAERYVARIEEIAP